jgi:hypothetical protein
MGNGSGRLPWFRAYVCLFTIFCGVYVSAGIGKSMFRGYLLYRLCQHHAATTSAFTVVLQNAPDPPGQTASGFCELLQFSPGAPTQLHSERSPSLKLPAAWKLLLRDAAVGASVYYITDGISPDVLDLDPTRVRLLEVSSPQEARWKPFVKGMAASKVVQRFMPLVSLGEMQHMREHVGAVETAAEVQARYIVLGGSVRGVLVQCKQDTAEIVDHALSHATSLDAVLSSSTVSGELQGAGLAHIPSTLVHFRVSEDQEASGALVTEAGEIAPQPSVAPPLSKYEPIFASNYVRRAIVSKFHSKFISVLGEMVRTPDLPSTSVLQGNLFEEFVHQRLQSAVSNPCLLRSLDSAAAAFATSTVDLSAYTCVEFDDVSELGAMELQEGRYYKPISKSFGAVDFVLGTQVVGNMTLNLRHGISITALLRVVRAMGSVPVEGEERPVLRFYWILPTRSLFQRMKKQPLSYGGRVIPPHDASGAVTGSAAEMFQKLQELEQLVRLQQFAVYMPPSESEEAAEEGGKTQELEAEDSAAGMQLVQDEDAVQGDAAAAAAAAGGAAPETRKRKAAQTTSATAGASTPKRGGGGGRGGRGGGAAAARQGTR